MNTFQLRTLMLTVVLSLVVALAACQPASTPSESAESGDSGSSSGETMRMAFGGGPVGGAFQTFANTMSLIMAENNENLEIAAEGTGGSGANLRGVNSDDVQFGISYGGDIYLGALGQLPDDETEYTNVRPIAAIYGGIAHLIVRADSGIESVADLPGKRIAPGNAGSGAALSAERYFTQLGIYDDLNIEFLGYSQAAAAMGDGQLDGFWVLAAFPVSAVTEAATLAEIRLLDTATAGEEANLFVDLPFYSPRTLQGGVYEGVDEDVQSFQDTATWTANKDVPDDVVYAALEAVFSEDGLQRMRDAHPAAGEMSIESGLTGISVPLHPGAYQFWKDQGLEIPEAITPAE